MNAYSRHYLIDDKSIGRQVRSRYIFGVCYFWSREKDRPFWSRETVLTDHVIRQYQEIQFQFFLIKHDKILRFSKYHPEWRTKNLVWFCKKNINFMYVRHAHTSHCHHQYQVFFELEPFTAWTFYVSYLDY